MIFPQYDKKFPKCDDRVVERDSRHTQEVFLPVLDNHVSRPKGAGNERAWPWQYSSSRP